MDRTRIVKLTLLAGAAVSLQGCVAAIAPIAAASGVFGSTATRGSGEDIAAAPAATPAPASDPRVIVEPSDQRASEEGTFVAEISAPVPEPGRSALARDEMDVAADRVSMDEPEEVSAMAAMADAEPVAVGSLEPSTAFDTGSVAGPAQTQSEPAATRLALAVPAAAEADPVPGPVAAEERIVEAEPLRIIAVDPQVALADTSTSSASVSAAEAAAALNALAANAEPEPAPAALARTPRAAAPEPTPSATTIAEAGMAPAPAPAETLAMSAAASAAVPPPPAPPPPAPEPAPEPAVERPAPRPMATGAFASLINYANRQQARSADQRRSAVLADRASLMPTRSPCGGAEPTVLIDLDPEGDSFDPTNVPRAAPGLSSALAQMRAMGVKIAWISSNAQGQVGAIREALNRSGLDLDNSDQLLLMRYPEDRKQTRREDLAASSCLIAIAGDKRTDFDELFEYLINPEAAASLDPLIENGWFIIPQPLITERPSE